MFRLGVVGGGRMGLTHIRALAASELIETVAVVEPSRTSAARLPQDVAVLPTLDALLELSRPDGVLVAAPSDVHVDIVQTLAKAKVPILCEKPCGLSTHETRMCADIVASTGLPFQVAYWRRFVPELDELRRDIRDGAFGNLYVASCWQWDMEIPSREFRVRSGGICIDMGVHEFDQLRWLTGQEFATLQTFAPAVLSAADVPGDPESVQILAELSGGTAATVSLGRRFPLGDMARIEVFGTRDSRECRFLHAASGQSTLFSALLAQAESFARYATGGPREGASIHDAVAALEAAERATAHLLANERK